MAFVLMHRVLGQQLHKILTNILETNAILG